MNASELTTGSTVLNHCKTQWYWLVIILYSSERIPVSMDLIKVIIILKINFSDFLSFFYIQNLLLVLIFNFFCIEKVLFFHRKSNYFKMVSILQSLATCTLIQCWALVHTVSYYWKVFWLLLLFVIIWGYLELWRVQSIVKTSFSSRSK